MAKAIKNNKQNPGNVVTKVIWVLFNVLKTFHSLGGARPQYLSNRLSPIFAFTTFNYTISALDRVLYWSGSARNQHIWIV